jgi:hypothetical protein
MSLIWLLCVEKILHQCEFNSQSFRNVENYKISDCRKESSLVALLEWFFTLNFTLTKNCNHFGIVTHMILTPT